MKNLPLSAVYKLIEPGPVVFLTAAHRGKQNIMTMSWHMMVDFVPPMLSCVVSESNHSFTALRATKECVIAIPSVDLAIHVVKIGNCSGADVDKFERFKLTPEKAKTVNAPLIKECFANLECKVINTTMVKRFNLFILEVQKAWIDPKQENPKMIHHRGQGLFIVDGKSIKLKSGKL